MRRYGWLLLSVLVAYTLLFGQFLREHWVHDAYLVAQTGYGRMPGPLLSQGRVFSALFYRVLEAVAMPYPAAMALTVFCSLVFLTLAVLVVFDGSDALRDSGRPGQAVAVLAGCALFFNLFVPELFLFFESAVMALGIFLAALAARALVGAVRLRGYLASLLILTASMFCYQADVAFFLPLVVYLLAARGERLWKKTIAAGFVYGATCLSTLLFLRLFATDTRVGERVDWVLNLTRCVKLLGLILKDAFRFLPAWCFPALLLLSAGTLVWTCMWAKRYARLGAALVACFALVVCTLLPLLALASDHWYAVPRAVVALAGLPGLILLFLPRAGRGQAVVAAVLVLAISAVQIDYQWSNRKNSALDAGEIAQIVQMVQAHEAQTGVPLKRVEVTYDASPVYYRPNLRHYGDATIRILSVSWMPKPMLTHALGNRIPVEVMSAETARLMFGATDRDATDPGQFVFQDNILYLCIY